MNVTVSPPFHDVPLNRIWPEAKIWATIPQESRLGAEIIKGVLNPPKYQHAGRKLLNWLLDCFHFLLRMGNFLSKDEQSQRQGLRDYENLCTSKSSFMHARLIHRSFNMGWETKREKKSLAFGEKEWPNSRSEEFLSFLLHWPWDLHRWGGKLPLLSLDFPCHAR